MESTRIDLQHNMDIKNLDNEIISLDGLLIAEDYFEEMPDNALYLQPEDIDKATAFNYTFDSGSIPEEYWWRCFVIITHQHISLQVFGNYGGILYDEIFDLTSEQYDRFKSDLKKKNIAHCNESGSISYCLDGASSSSLTVLQDDQLLFEANSEDFIHYSSNSRSLKEAIYNALPIGEPRTVFCSPDSVLKDVSTKFDQQLDGTPVLIDIDSNFSGEEPMGEIGEYDFIG